MIFVFALYGPLGSLSNIEETTANGEGTGRKRKDGVKWSHGEDGGGEGTEFRIGMGRERNLGVAVYKHTV